MLSQSPRDPADAAIDTLTSLNGPDALVTLAHARNAITLRMEHLLDAHLGTDPGAAGH